MIRAALLTAVVVVGVAAWARVDRSHGAATATGCGRATPLRKVVVGGKSRFIARLANYDIVGLGGRPSRVVTAPLYPHYPDALLVGGIGIQARHKIAAPVTLTASYCSGGRIGLFSFAGRRGGPSIPRPATASVVRRTGAQQATITWPPPIGSPPDKPEWLVTLYFYKPGLAVLRLAQAGRVIDRLTFKVCVAGGPHLACL